MLYRIDADAAEQVLAEHDGDPAERRGAYQHQFRPSEEKGFATAPSLAEVRVEATGLRQRGGKLGKRQRAAQGDETAGDPEPEHQRRTGNLLRDPRRRSEDPRADRNAD